jgi:hypothetical protein
VAPVAAEGDAVDFLAYDGAGIFLRVLLLLWVLLFVVGGGGGKKAGGRGRNYLRAIRNNFFIARNFP